MHHRCNTLPQARHTEKRRGKTFQLPETAARIYAIYGNAGKKYCFDYVSVPGGNEPLFFSGESYYDPTRGNPFRFEGNPKRGKPRLFPIILGVILGVAIGLGTIFLLRDKAELMTFSAEELTITLTDDFVQKSEPGITVRFSDGVVVILAQKEQFNPTSSLSAMTADEYAELFCEANDFPVEELRREDGLIYLEQTQTMDSVEGEALEYRIFTTLHKGGGAFWRVEFIVVEERAERYRDEFFTWAKSIEFPVET